MTSKKRERDEQQDGVPWDSAPAHSDPSPVAAGPGGSANNFRNVSACNRCRTRKNRCDQKLPRCSGCEKANVKCVGFDPVSKREIPRSYVYYLETRLHNLEAILQSHDIAYPPASEDFSISDAIVPGVNVPYPPLDEEPKLLKSSHHSRSSAASNDHLLHGPDDVEPVEEASRAFGVLPLRPDGAKSSRARQTPSTAIPFSTVVYAAVKSSVAQTRTPPEAAAKELHPPSRTASGGGGSASFFALHAKPTAKPAPFPDHAAGLHLAELYFEHANPQMPILHRPTFMALFEKVYALPTDQRNARQLYLLNIVFAIGSGIIMDSPSTDSGSTEPAPSTEKRDQPTRKRQKTISRARYQPEEFHAAAIIHLENFLETPPALEGISSGLEDLKAVLLLAGVALLRPIAPGLWYIVGVAIRLAIDLGLHFEDSDADLDQRAYASTEPPSKSKGRRQWARDVRRRLWWCAFAFDRLVSTCVGRPPCISDQVVTTAFPSMLDDKYITPAGFLKPPLAEDLPSYKLVARHYLRLRILQSEILQVLQHRQAEQARSDQAIARRYYIRPDLPSPYLSGFKSFREWRLDVDRRLWEWNESAPTQPDTGVQFSPLFLQLNYWQAVILLYRQSLAVPEPLIGELNPSTGDSVRSPGTAALEVDEDKQLVFMKVAQAGQSVLKTYRQLHRLKLVNYTFLATHHIFMSGVSFLYAIWHSTLVRSQLTLDDVDFTILIATSVLADLIPNCPPAEACRDALLRMSKVTISTVMKTTGFGNRSTLATQPLNSPGGYFSPDNNTSDDFTTIPPKLEMDLKDFFSDEELAIPDFHHQQLQFPSPPIPHLLSPTLHQSSYFPTQMSSLNSTNSNPTSGSLFGNAGGGGPFDTLDFLETYPITDPSLNFWGMTTNTNHLQQQKQQQQQQQQQSQQSLSPTAFFQQQQSNGLDFGGLGFLGSDQPRPSGSAPGSVTGGSTSGQHGQFTGCEEVFGSPVMGSHNQ